MSKSVIFVQQLRVFCAVLNLRERLANSRSDIRDPGTPLATNHLRKSFIARGGGESGPQGHFARTLLKTLLRNHRAGAERNG
jgi:hypothetical protein